MSKNETTQTTNTIEGTKTLGLKGMKTPGLQSLQTLGLSRRKNRRKTGW